MLDARPQNWSGGGAEIGKAPYSSFEIIRGVGHLKIDRTSEKKVGHKKGLAPPFLDSIMYFVYILKNKRSSSLYIGFTNNLRRRLKEHAEGKSKYVGHRGVLYYEAYKSMKDAQIREKMLKKYGSSYGHLKQRIKSSLF